MKEIKIDVQYLKSTITGKYMYLVNIGGIIKFCKSEKSVFRYLYNLGYRWDIEKGGFYKTCLSVKEKFIEQKFTTN